MTARAVLLALVVSLLYASPAAASFATTTYFRDTERPEWQLDTPTAASLRTATASAPAAAAGDAGSRVAAGEAHSFLWTFPLRNMDWLQREVDETSDPSHHRYLQRLPQHAVDAMIGPTPAEKAEVLAWLRGYGLQPGADVDDWRHVLNVRASVGVVEALFNTTIHRYRHAADGRVAHVARSAVHVPAALAPRLALLDGLYDFPHRVYTMHAIHAPAAATHTMRTMQQQETNAQCPANSGRGFIPILQPSLLASQYNFALRDTATSPQSTSAAVAGGFAGTENNQNYNEAFSPADLTYFQQNIGFSQSFVAANYGNSNNQNNLNGNPSGATSEATLDIQALFQVSPTSTNGFYAVTGRSSGLYTSLAGINGLSASVRPQVVSYSYAFGDSDFEYFSTSQGQATENVLIQLAQAGVTVIASAGDDGAPGAGNTQCAAVGTLGATKAPATYATSVMLPQYPASSRYVLSVAETQFLGGATGDINRYFSGSVTSPPGCNNCPTDQQTAYLCQSVLANETAVSVTNAIGGRANDGTTTGGGFSYVWGQPSWQSAAVGAYLNQYCTAANNCRLPASSQYNSQNRAYPDVSAFGGYFGIVQNGQEGGVSGTSVSAPIWAGLIARLNEVTLAKTGTTLGYVQPTLYNMSAVAPSTFHDITTGNNVCPRNNAGCVSAVNSGGSTSCAGFFAAPGWDPVTGLGSPNIGNMIQFLQSGYVPPGTGGAIYFASSGRNAAATVVSGTAALWLSLLLAVVAMLI